MQVGRLQATSGLAVVEVENSLDHIGIGEQGKHCLWIRYVGRRMAFTHGPVRADLIQVNAGDAGTTPQHLGHTLGGVGMQYDDGTAHAALRRSGCGMSFCPYR